jgi:molybdate transport system ATP-binding protein
LFTRLDLALTQDLEAAAIIDAEVTGHDEEFQLSELAFPGGRFSVPRQHLAPGSRVRLRLSARDVSLTLARQSGTSILNIFPATVDALMPFGPAQVTVRLLAGGVPLLARVTRKSVAALGLQQGMMVYAQAKSVALLS